MRDLFIKNNECRCVVMVVVFSSPLIPTMSPVNCDLQNTVDNDTNTLYLSNSAAQLKQTCGVPKTAVSEHNNTSGAVGYRLILEGSKESDI